ncbi:MAG: argininosuccinate lyase, partial [Spirochaetales bacterium]
MAKLWQGSSDGLGLNPDIEVFLSSLSVDSRLLGEDIECSIAHAAMLGKQGILPMDESEAISAALVLMLAEAAAGTLPIDPESEDIHSFIEAELTKRLGETGKAVHAGRSRNDQVAVAFRLYIVRAFDRTAEAALAAMRSALDLASKHKETIMPGYTHLQRAQPVTLAHHLLAWCAALERDIGRLRDARARADECPLGAGALAGSGLPTDREFTAAALGFARPSRNTMDAVADRDACADYAAACSSIMVHLSRACEDIALWVSTEYGFATITDAASTGSSIMPQKRNPDPAELIRGKSARVLGALQALLVLQKGLPYAYNRDLQEDKELFFDVEKTTIG